MQPQIADVQKHPWLIEPKVWTEYFIKIVYLDSHLFKAV